MPSSSSVVIACRRLAVLAMLAVLSTLSLSSRPLSAQVSPFFGSPLGPYSVSVDAAGSSQGFHTIDVEKPSGSAKVRWAFFLAASSSGRTIENGDVVLEDVAITWDGAAFHAPPQLPSFYNTVADVTAIVAPLVDPAAAGRILLTVDEVGPTTVDGEVLAVVFEDPDQSEQRIVWFAFGASSTATDTFLVSFLNPLDPSLPGAVADVGLGLSASLQSEPDSPAAARIVEVDKVTLTSAAGGADDGEPSPGGRITAGGLDDSNANPADPDAPPNGDPRFDDELYSLLPFLDTGRTRYEASTFNETPIDNFFFAHFVFSQFAVVGEGLFLGPEDAVNETGTDHALEARVFGRDSLPLAGVEVSFLVESGPNRGVAGSMVTGEDGVAPFTYTGNGGEGVDRIVASYVRRLDEATTINATSNVVTKHWIAPFEVTLTPASASALEAARHTLTAEVTGAGGAPEPGVDVMFKVIEGPNLGPIGSAVTGEDGRAEVTYAGLGGPGLDRVEASVVDRLGVTRTSPPASVEWIAPVLADPRPDLASSGDGRILVVRESGTGLTEIVGELNDMEGNVLVRELISDGVSVDRSPSVARLTGGFYVVAYLQGRPLPNAVLLRLVGDDGLVAGGPFVVDSIREVCDLDPATECPFAHPDVAALPDGGFVVVWEKSGTLLGAFFDDQGGAAGRPFVVASDPSGASFFTAPEVVVMANGTLAVAYQAIGGEASEVRLARFNARGRRAADMAVAPASGGFQAAPAIASAPPSGDPVVLWESFSGIFGRVDPEDGAQPSFQVNSTIAGEQLGPSLAVGPSGLLAAVWLDAERGLLAVQRFASDLLFVDREGEATVNALIGSSESSPVLGRPRAVALSDGSLAVVAGVAGSAMDADGGAVLAFAPPSRLAACFSDGRLVPPGGSAGLSCVKLRLRHSQGKLRGPFPREIP